MAKFPGISIDEYLEWNDHIDHILTKVARSLFFVKQ